MIYLMSDGNRLDVVQELTSLSDINYLNRQGIHALCISISKRKCFEIIEWLIHKGSNLYLGFGKHYMYHSMLVFGVMSKCDYRAIQLMIHKGGDVN
jgi:hypothetical protein